MQYRDLFFWDSSLLLHLSTFDIHGFPSDRVSHETNTVYRSLMKCIKPNAFYLIQHFQYSYRIKSLSRPSYY